MDLKGSFRTQDGRRVFALTVRDVASRYILCVQHVPRADEKHIGWLLRRLFRRYGLPRAIRMDNGAPFGAGGPRGWSRLSVQWIKLGIRTEYGRPRHPEDNPEHEQMHRVLKDATARPPSRNLAAQQRRFEQWRKRYNERRPHESLGMNRPCSRYQPSRRRLPTNMPPWTYPDGWLLMCPDPKGRCFWERRQRLLGQAFVGEQLGARSIRPGVLAVYYRQHLIGTLHAIDLAGLRPVSARPTQPSGRGCAPPSTHPDLIR
jgi:putative transposase